MGTARTGAGRSSALVALAALLALSLLLPVSARGQLGSMPRDLRSESGVAPGEIISMSSSLSFRDAVTIFSELSQTYLGKVIVDPQNRTAPIGIDVNNRHWITAFEMVLRQNDLWYEEYADHILIVEKGKGSVDEEAITNRELFQTREVTITAVFFELNRSKLRQMGSQWDFLNAEGTLSASVSAAGNKPSLMELQLGNTYSFGDVLGIFKVLENQQVGSIIASPKVTVRSGKKGRVQIGSDFSVTTKDFAGNTVTQFFSTGSIIEVTPTIVTIDSVTFVHLELMVEKSSAAASGELGTEIKKSTAETFLMLLDEEETLIGGLHNVEETVTREGVPILKDLPWWVLGLRYIFGFETMQVTEKELLILMKAELLPTIYDRVMERRRRMPTERPRIIEEELQKGQEALEFYKSQDINEADRDTTKTMEP